VRPPLFWYSPSERGEVGRGRSERRDALLGRCSSFGLGAPRTRRSTKCRISELRGLHVPGHTVSDRRSDITAMTPASSDDGKDRNDARFQCLHVTAQPANRPHHRDPTKILLIAAKRPPPRPLAVDCDRRLQNQFHQQSLGLITRYSCAAVSTRSLLASFPRKAGTQSNQNPVCRAGPPPSWGRRRMRKGNHPSGSTRNRFNQMTRPVSAPYRTFRIWIDRSAWDAAISPSPTACQRRRRSVGHHRRMIYYGLS
jgi:hypothetical protein